MKKRFLVLFGLFLMALIVTSLYFWLLRDDSDPQLSDAILPSGSFFDGGINTDGQGSSAPSLKLKSGGRLPVQNFLLEPDVEQLADDYYRILEESDPQGAYASAYYYTDDGGIIILLTREPLALSRRLAEEELKEKLGLSEETLCELDVLVQTNRFVNITYAGRNLGLSFCPGSVNLE